MKEKEYLIIDDFFCDKFELPLSEDNDIGDYYTIPEFRNEVAKRIKELSGLGYKISIEQIFLGDL